jgi:DNA-binding MarR family transcriptional regulator
MLTSIGSRAARHNPRIPAKPKATLSSPQKPPSSLSRLYARPGFLLRRAHQISAAVFEDECRELALTPAQFGVLTVLQAHPGLGQSSLARALGFDKVTVLRVLRGLQARGFVTRCPAETNRRNMMVGLTPAGEEILAQAQKPAEKAYQRLMAPLDRTQQEQLLQLLQQLTGELEDDARAAFVPPTGAPAPRQLA